MTVELSTVIATGAVLSAAVGAVLVLRRLLHRVKYLEGQQTFIGAEAIPINLAMQHLLVKELTHDHAPEMDALMVLLSPDEIDEEEEQRLFVLLEQREQNAETDHEKEAAKALPIFMRRARKEAEALKQGDKARLRFVTLHPSRADEVTNDPD